MTIRPEMEKEKGRERDIQIKIMFLGENTSKAFDLQQIVTFL